MIDFLVDGKVDAPRTIVLAHGAGAPMDSPFMNEIAALLGEGESRVVRFEFPYMVRRRREGGRRPPNRAPVLETTWRDVVNELGDPATLVIGGKSMGGRIASHVADELGVAGLVCLGYPFHPPGKPERTRTAHLAELRTPTLIVQGERDPFGKPEEVQTYRLADSIRIEWIGDGDHSLTPRKRSGRTLADAMGETAELVSAFVSAL